MNAKQVTQMFAAMDKSAELGDNMAGNIDSEWTADTDMPTAEELAQEAAYYAHLEAQQQATDNLMRQLSEAVGDDDGDDMGYCGPTCGRFGNW